MKQLFATTLAGFLLVIPATAQNVPAEPAFSNAMDAIANDDWDRAYALVGDAGDVSRDLVTWMRLRDGAGRFPDFTAFLAARPDWPGLSSVRAQAERALTGDEPAATVLAFFQGAEVETGEGAVAYTDALIAQGRRAEAEAMLGRVWRGLGLDDAGHQAVINAYPDILAPHHEARADAMLWRWRRSDAANELPHLGEGYQALVRARIALVARSGDSDARLALVPDRLQNDAGLAYDRFNLLAGRGDLTDAMEILRARSISADALGQPWRWGSWRRIIARWQMREGEAASAYALASQHFIAPEEDNYPDLEWLSGYIALTYLDDAALAKTHFTRFDAAVTSPISKGRAGYWLGRAEDALGNTDAATAAYQAGAQHQTSFYGLLSAERLGLPLDPDLAGGAPFGDWQDSDLLANDLIEAGLLLLGADQRGLAVLFFAQAADFLTPEEIGQLAALFMEMEEPFYAILVAKTAVRRGLVVHDAYFPIHPMAQMDLPVEPALALAIARQESEFRTDAGSSVGALGLMQLMPATAQEVAQGLGLPYSRARLITDWGYNATLGSRYLAYLTGQFGDAPVMIAAGYNAGPSRPRAWMDERGDPRRGFGHDNTVDVIDWIEHIPFRETRNYVMRVTEAVPVYRARLGGDIGPVQFTDLLKGVAPVVRPLARPARAAQAPATPPDATVRPPVRRAGQTAPSVPAAPSGTRPIPRAGDN